MKEEISNRDLLEIINKKFADFDFHLEKIRKDLNNIYFISTQNKNAIDNTASKMNLNDAVEKVLTLVEINKSEILGAFQDTHVTTMQKYIGLESRLELLEEKVL